MTGREYFEHIRSLIDQKNDMQRRVSDLRAALTAVGGLSYDRPDIQKSKVQDRMAEKVIELTDLTLEMIDATQKVHNEINEADIRLNQMSRREFSRVIRMRYLMEVRHSWGWIADEMGYSEDRIKHLCREALTEFEGRWLNDQG